MVGRALGGTHRSRPQGGGGERLRALKENSEPREVPTPVRTVNVAPQEPIFMRTEHFIVQENVKDEQPEEKGKAREASFPTVTASRGSSSCDLLTVAASPVAEQGSSISEHQELVELRVQGKEVIFSQPGIQSLEKKERTQDEKNRRNWREVEKEFCVYKGRKLFSSRVYGIRIDSAPWKPLYTRIMSPVTVALSPVAPDGRMLYSFCRFLRLFTNQSTFSFLLFLNKVANFVVVATRPPPPPGSSLRSTVRGSRGTAPVAQRSRRRLPMQLWVFLGKPGKGGLVRGTLASRYVNVKNCSDSASGKSSVARTDGDQQSLSSLGQGCCMTSGSDKQPLRPGRLSLSPASKRPPDLDSIKLTAQGKPEYVWGSCNFRDADKNCGFHFRSEDTVQFSMIIYMDGDVGFVKKETQSWYHDTTEETSQNLRATAI
ncbi:hypothetical protein MJT46_009399 [Ovis ammon polii x Ovis aries]|nr:hypothetical protein MJT46_009399 [Ovis ammon polii x Ovis aries]